LTPHEWVDVVAEGLLLLSVALLAFPAAKVGKDLLLEERMGGQSPDASPQNANVAKVGDSSQPSVATARALLANSAKENRESRAAGLFEYRCLMGAFILAAFSSIIKIVSIVLFAGHA
jgi:hypothetical protein